MTNEEALPPEPAAEEVTVEKLDAHVKKMAALKIEIKALEDQAKPLNLELQRMSEQAMLYLKALGRKNYPTPFGTIYILRKWQTKLPQTDADKALLFGWLREQGLFDKYATVNSISLNSLYVKEIERVSRESPEDALVFTIPGVERPKMYETVSVLKGKGESDES